MHTIIMPQAGNTMEDGTIVRWHKAEGDVVRAGEVLLEIDTDKATVEVESDHSGTLRKILVGEGETVAVLTPIALLGAPDEETPEKLPAGEAAAPVAETPEPAATAEPNAPAPEAAGAVAAIVMPQAGNTMEEGILVKWRVAVGDRINAGDVVFEAETDKAVVEVEADQAGRIARLIAEEGDIVPVKTPVAYLAESDADVDAFLAASAGGAVSPMAAAAPAELQPRLPAPTAVAAAPADGVKASPAARKLARQRNIDLAAIGAGRGPGGRILTADVLVAKPAAAAPAAPGEPVRRPMSRMRKAIARNLQASKQTIPHFYIQMTVDAGPMMAFYRAAKAQFACTINDVIVAACARAVAELPALRSRIDGTDLIEYPTANIGIAVGMDDGLVVPVLVAAERLSLERIGAESRRIAEAARAGRIEGLGQGVFTVTNLGMFGVSQFAAIINPPEAAILAVGAVREEVIVRDGAIRPGKVVTLTLSCDHRVVDGLVAARFLARLKELLEAPDVLA